MFGTLLGGFALLLSLSQPIESAPQKQSAQSSRSALIFDQDTRLDCNNLEMFIYNDGNFAYDNANILTKTDGLYYPRGTKKTVVYSAGIWVGAKVNGEVRLAISEYGTEFVPGPMLNGTHQPDNASFRVYKINRNDNDATNPDYTNWPVDQGAPIDENGDPLILGDQMTWSVFNDADLSNHNIDAGSTLPLGLEIQHTGFGLNRNGPLANVYYLKYKLINKGGHNLEDAYVSIWADPDLGDPSNDLVGCDTMLSLGYCYNEGPDATYGANPPAVGFDLFQGPIVPAEPTDSALVNGTWRHGFKNLGMTSFNKYINGTDPANSVETYGYMRGLVKDPISGLMVPMVNPISDMVTNYAVSGNPVNQTGWIDVAAADRRLMLSAGPFNMAPGDTQEVVVAVLVGQGSSALNSISQLFVSDYIVQSSYDADFLFTSVSDCGDLDESGDANLTDVMHLLNYLFAHAPAPIDPDDADVNCDGLIRITDCVYLVNYIFLGGNAPCAACE